MPKQVPEQVPEQGQWHCIFSAPEIGAQNQAAGLTEAEGTLPGQQGHLQMIRIIAAESALPLPAGCPSPAFRQTEAATLLLHLPARPQATGQIRRPPLSH